MTAVRSPWRPVVGIALAALAVVYLFPFLWLLSTSLKPTPELYTQPPTLAPVHPSLEAYRVALVEGRTGSSWGTAWSSAWRRWS